MKARVNRLLRSWLRDMVLGAAIFLMLPLGATLFSGRDLGWSASEARASEIMALQAGDIAFEPGVSPESLLGAIARLLGAQDMLPERPTEFLVLGLSFSLLVALNLAFARHLRRVSAPRRRDAAGPRR